MATQLVEWAGSIAKNDPVVHAVRASVYAAMRERETSLMARGVYKVRACCVNSRLRYALGRWRRADGLFFFVFRWLTIILVNYHPGASSGGAASERGGTG